MGSQPLVMNGSSSHLEDSRRVFERLGLPFGNGYELRDSDQRFPDGSHYRQEVPGLQTPEAVSAALDAAKQRGLTIHRVTHTIGIMRNTDYEIREMSRICNDFGAELILSVGPRATYDLSPSVHTPEGVRIGYRLRGGEQLLRAIEDVRRAVDLGVRGIMCYDEGLLWVLDEMRTAGELPANLHVKVSAHTGHGNPASMKVLERLGANSINPVRDLDVPMWASLRQATTLPMDLSTEAPKSSGGFLRDYDVPEIVRVAAPIYCKSGGFEMTAHAFATSADDARGYVKRVELVQRAIHTYFPEAILGEAGHESMSIPEIV